MELILILIMLNAQTMLKELLKQKLKQQQLAGVKSVIKKQVLPVNFFIEAILKTEQLKKQLQM